MMEAKLLNALRTQMIITSLYTTHADRFSKMLASYKEAYPTLPPIEDLLARNMLSGDKLVSYFTPISVEVRSEQLKQN